MIELLGGSERECPPRRNLGDTFPPPFLDERTRLGRFRTYGGAPWAASG